MLYVGITADGIEARSGINAVERTAFRTPDYADTSHSWPIHWGRQLDIRPLGLSGDEITAEAVAGYLAKYARRRPSHPDCRSPPG